jgi:LysR family glycine cleavage system transcriptional activator
MRPPSLRAIVAFEAAARHGTFREAARELNLTDSAVSHAIRGLEERSGHPLFRREPGGLRLTPEGRALSARVSVALSLLGEAFGGPLRRPPARVVVSAMPAFAERVLAARLPRFWQACPDADLELRASPELVDFADGGVDVGLRYGMGRWAGARTELLVRTPLVVVASPGYRGGDLPRTLDQLAQCDLIEDPCTSWRPVWPGAAEPASPGRRLKVDDISTAFWAAEAGAGVMLAPWILAAADLAAGRLARVTSVAVATPCGFWLAWKDAADRKPGVAAFAEWLLGELRGLREDPLQQVA